MKCFWSHCDQGVAVMEYLICCSVWKTLILRCESDMLYPKIALTLQNSRHPTGTETQLPSSPKATSSQFGHWAKWELAPAAVAEPMAEPWSHSWGQTPRDSPTQGHLPMLTHTDSPGFLDSPNKSEGSLRALTPVQSGSTTIPIPICLSEICKHSKCTTEIAQGAKSCPSVSELACD